MATLAQTIRFYRQLCATQIARFAAWSAQLTRRSLTMAYRSAVSLLQDFRAGARALQSFVSNLWVIFQEIPQLSWSILRSTYQLLLRALTAGYQFINTISPVIHWMASMTLSVLSHIIGLIVGVCAAVFDVFVDSMRFLGRSAIHPSVANKPIKPRPMVPPVTPKSNTRAKSVAKPPITQKVRQERCHSSPPVAHATKRRQRPAH